MRQGVTWYLGKRCVWNWLEITERLDDLCRRTVLLVSETQLCHYAESSRLALARKQILQLTGGSSHKKKPWHIHDMEQFIIEASRVKHLLPLKPVQISAESAIRFAVNPHSGDLKLTAFVGIWIPCSSTTKNKLQIREVVQIHNKKIQKCIVMIPVEPLLQLLLSWSSTVGRIQIE